MGAGILCDSDAGRRADDVSVITAAWEGVKH